MKVIEFDITDQNGKKHKIADYKGKKLILYFYPKDLTPGCTAESCNLRDSYDDLLEKGLDVIGVSPDSEISHKKFIDKYKLPFRLISDPEKKQIYDQHGHAGVDGRYSTEDIFQGAQGGGFDSIFESIFGRGGGGFGGGGGFSGGGGSFGGGGASGSW